MKQAPKNTPKRCAADIAAILGLSVICTVIMIESPQRDDFQSSVNYRSDQPQVDLDRERREIEQTFRRYFPDAQYTDLDKDDSDGGMVGFVREMIGGGSALASVYPERGSELRQWENLKVQMDRYKQLKSDTRR